MFPLNSNMPYIKNNGERDKLGNVIGSGGGGSFTPDYENDRLIIGVHDDFNYFIPMSKEYIGSGIEGYEIETNSASTQYSAKIDIYSIIFVDGEVTHKSLIKTLVHNYDKNYEDDNISVTYDGNWKVTSKVPLYNESGVVYESSWSWAYDTQVNYVMLIEDPTA